MESLVSLATKRMQKRIDYESSRGEGSLTRKKLSNLKGKRSRVTGTLVRKSGSRYVLKKVNVGGINIDHLNIGTKGEPKLLQILPFLTRANTKLSFTAEIYEYSRLGVKTYGVCNVRNIQILGFRSDRFTAFDYESLSVLGSDSDYYLDFNTSPKTFGLQSINLPKSLNFAGDVGDYHNFLAYLSLSLAFKHYDTRDWLMRVVWVMQKSKSVFATSYYWLHYYKTSNMFPSKSEFSEGLEYFTKSNPKLVELSNKLAKSMKNVFTNVIGEEFSKVSHDVKGFENNFFLPNILKLSAKSSFKYVLILPSFSGKVSAMWVENYLKVSKICGGSVLVYNSLTCQFSSLVYTGKTIKYKEVIV